MQTSATTPVVLGTFGKRLKVVRTERGLSQTELRDEMERQCNVRIGQTYISELERAGKAPTLEVASAMATVLGVSLDYFGLLINEPIPYNRPQEATAAHAAA